MGGLWPQLAGSISPLSLLASSRGWVCPNRQMSLGLLAGAVQRAAGPWGRWEVDLVRLNHIVRGWAGSQEALLKTLT